MDGSSYLQSMARLGAGGVVLSLSLSGCMIPPYQQPQGFSSTYYKHLQDVTAQNAAIMSGTQLPGAPVINSPLIIEPPPKPPVTKPLPKPIESTEDPIDSKAETSADQTGSWWSWIRRPLTYRSSADKDFGAELDADDELPVRK